MRIDMNLHQSRILEVRRKNHLSPMCFNEIKKKKNNIDIFRAYKACKNNSRSVEEGEVSEECLKLETIVNLILF